MLRSSVLSSPEAIMAAAQNYFQSNLRDPGLAPASIAFNLGISLRTPHRAFEDLSVAKLVRVQRLAAARHDTLAGSRSQQVLEAHTPCTVSPVTVTWE